MKNTLLLVSLVFLSFNIQAQYKDWTKAKIYLKDGSTLKGNARLTMLESKVRSAVFGSKGENSFNLSSKEYLRYINFEIKQRKSTKFTPEEVEKVVFDLDYKLKGRRLKRQAVYIPIIKSINKKKTKFGFAELVIDGEVKLVKRTVSNTNYGSVFKESLLIRDNDMAIIFNYAELKSFKKRASEYFSDCPSLVSKVESKKYTRKDLEGLVNHYNDNCAK